MAPAWYTKAKPGLQLTNMVTHAGLFSLLWAAARFEPVTAWREAQTQLLILVALSINSDFQTKSTKIGNIFRGSRFPLNLDPVHNKSN